jgi:hypothetical protein
LAQPVTVKAVLMVSAWHDVDGAGVLSDKDGAGSIDSAAAWAVVRDHQWWHETVTAGSFTADLLDVKLPLLRGDETRVIASWMSRASSSFSTDVLDMDLDLSVLDPNGVPVAVSASPFNPFELASFVPALTGEYTVRLTKQRFTGTSEPLTVAWSSRSDTATARIVLGPGSEFAVGETPELVIEERYTGANHPYFAWVSVTPASGQSLPGGYTMPVDFDVLSDLLLGLPNYAGNLDAEGRATLAFALPDLWFTVGWAFRFGVLVLEPGAQLAIHALAPEALMIVQP